MRPTVSSRGAVSQETAKELARILKSLVGRSPHCVHNTMDFLQKTKGIQLQHDECIMSYDVKAFFTSVPIDLPSRSSKTSQERTKSFNKEHP